MLAFEWFTDPKAKRQVAEILNRFHLDETAISRGDQERGR